MLKNIKMSKKLFFVLSSITTIFMIAVVIGGAMIMYLGKEANDFYNNQHTNMVYQLTVRSDMNAVAREILASFSEDSNARIQKNISNAVTRMDGVKSNYNLLQENLYDKELLSKIDTKMNTMWNTFDKIINLLKKGDQEAAQNMYHGQFKPVFDGTAIEFVNFAKLLEEQSVAMHNQIDTTKVVSVVILSAICVVAIAISVVLQLRLTKVILTPLREIELAAKDMAKGIVDVNINYTSKDELGSLAESMRTVFSRLKSILNDEAYLLTEMADGNFDVESLTPDEYVGDFTELLDCLKRINISLSGAFSSIFNAADQVNSSAEQVAFGAQSLSQGATEQASSIEELSATIEQVSDQVNKTAENANVTTKVTDDAGNELITSNKKMQEMITAMGKISSKSDEIGKIIKTIDDIAFQTNILALNAAVEAARAGSAGKGFAVVADEVRNLAAKSAEAAKNTAALIEETITAVENGNEILDVTAKSLATVLEGGAKSTELVTAIATATNEQAESITQITMGVEQISSVVQTNSATAEESAAASEELNGQAQMLKDILSQFNFSNDNGDFSSEETDSEEVLTH